MASKVERLRVAGSIAPALREQGKNERRVAIVDKDGKVVGYRSLTEVQKQILERAKIELDVADGERPKRVFCEACGAVVKVPKTGIVPSTCASGCRISCDGGCGKTPSRRVKSGQTWCCRDCAIARRRKYDRSELAEGVTPALVSSRVRAGWDVRRACATPRASRESQIDTLRKASIARSARSRSEASSKAWKKATPKERQDRTAAIRSLSSEKRSAAATKANASRSSERRSAIATSAAIAQSPEQRREKAMSGWATRRANAAAKNGGAS